MTPSAREPQHRSVDTQDAPVVRSESRPTPGAITVLPEAKGVFADAVLAGGGTLAALSPETRGLVWLTSGNSNDLVLALEQNPQIEWVQLPWAGVDAFSDVLASYAGQARPLFTSAKGAYSQPVAEHALTLLLALLRVIPTRVRATSWSHAAEGRSLYGLSVVIVGAGGIAVELVRLLEPFGCEITIVRRTDAAMPGVFRTVTSARLGEVLPGADALILAAAFTGDTTKLVGARELALLKPAAILVNIARGGLVDTDALVIALASHRLAGAGLDVTDPEPLPDGHPLFDEPRAIITPHSADTPDMTAPLLAERIRANVVAFHGDGRFVGVVDPAAGY